MHNQNVNPDEPFKMSSAPVEKKNVSYINNIKLCNIVYVNWSV